MSVDNSAIDASAIDASAIEAGAEVEPDGEVFFSTGSRIPSEAGSWTLLLVPVLVCLALLVFIALLPRG